MSKTPKAPIHKRLKYLFSGKADEATPSAVAQEPVRNALAGIPRDDLVRKMLLAMLDKRGPDMPLIRDILLRDPSILQDTYRVRGMSMGGQHPEMPWLCCAVSANDDGALVRFLIESGAPLTERDTLYKATPLGWAAMKGNKTAAEILLQAAGGIEDRKNQLGKTPAEIAAHFGHTELAAWLKSQEPMVPRIPSPSRQAKNPRGF